MDKQQLREFFLKRRIESATNYSTKIIANCLSFLKQYNNIKLAIYLAIKNEVDILNLTNQYQNCDYLLPKIIDHELSFVSFNKQNSLIMDEFGFKTSSSNEVAIPDIVLVPGVAFDKKGFRLGYGKGHYDKFISNNPDKIYVGIANQWQVIEQLPIESHDQQLNYIITEQGCFKTKEN